MPSIGHFKVTIEVNNEPADEFDDDDDEPAGPDMATKYIEAVPGAHFAIKCQVLPGYKFETDYLKFIIFSDGNYISAIRALKSKYDGERGMSVVRRHHVFGDGEDSAKRFSFSFADLNRRETLPGECVEDMRAKLKELGTISVQVWRKDIIGYKEIHSLDAIPPCATIEPVSEKALKGRALSLATT
jgi:hypothetical protein